MNHQPYLNWMQAALEAGEARLTPDQRAQLAEHLAACGECEAAWAALNEVERMLKAEPPAAPRPGFTSRFKARLAQRRSRPKTMWGALILGLSAVGAAALVLPVGVGLLGSTLRLAQQPATSAALFSGFNAVAVFGQAVFAALFIAARALIEWAVTNPLIWIASVTGLGVTGVWLYFIRKLVSEVSFR